MWKKSFRGRGKENTRIGDPVLIETSYDTRLLNRAKHRDLMEAANEAAASLRPPQIPPPRISNAASSIYSQPDPRFSKAASSVYSQPSPNDPYDHWPPNSGLGFAYPYDVSPVEESPSPYDDARRNSDVSESDDPKSRFSWSTRATPPTHFQHSPPPSPPPPLPAKYNTGRPLGPRDPPPQINASMFDKRPTSSIRTVSTTATTATIRKPVPTPSPSGTVTSMKRSQTLPMNNSNTPTPLASKPSTPKPTTPRSATPSSANKTLPLPPQLQDTESIVSSDPISKYSAQLDDLSLRRSNINRVIKDLTSLADINNPLAVDWSTKRANERKIKTLEDELTEIGAQEHDIGMRLHRARKKLEREEGYDMGSTTLWVRRVTNPV
ncbi:hypothetical protein UCRNP2_8139 [Neofusicoccum parvum UCRNP2]|uniref:Uncharacterized protein n=1 Tax=Botryosphaeria parva (strain UCR-NP2) TaxID=1287680 RepID=R1EBG8_BOTPV|nr:hypothetical protein UCRNP2_8139 [Neofusicoccum parvum UCRNP2]